MAADLDIIASMTLRQIEAAAEYGYGVSIRRQPRDVRAAVAQLAKLGLVEIREENFEAQAFLVTK